MEGGNSSTKSSSSLRWAILRRALLRRPSPLPDEQSQTNVERISRRATHGFNLIPCHVMEDVADENSNSQLETDHGSSSRDIRLCYRLPISGAPEIYLYQRMDDRAHLNDFEVSNRYNIDNTGLVCSWPSEDVLAHYCLCHADIFRNKKVIELGSGYGLAGLVIAAATEALEVLISDGNPQVVDYIQRNINANCSAFRGTLVKSMILHWDRAESLSGFNRFDIIVASDCTFFKEFHKSLAQTVNLFLRKEGPSEAIFFSPKRGDSLDKFLVEIKESGLHFSITEIYDTEVWRRHEGFISGNDAWPNYEKDHCYPLLVRITL
ncbi:calmodulin-lysine N-methyltransferase [Diospyros lotus]|uniref:calmodulin-lysine N-methyltransferase n=1 Tax=Diospyros lotus TaxID=55363 RepID=UPI00224CFA30|nr:calmodulin-lysine N-methyltransferase [Diospyros lotus]XP_052195843.1 calmodulin-lysine N-methyltransferase [Diospyros lotus]XP_052195844.1 calmodulin-lysine N-methyltransferase [Diospyros lotus]XP_052195845.1 calmodulin-lysine N-methyltransferase [Diospyros lotus]XP_052195846.1 calmodulin-lysine N-methyltransferase [Diospyros lotus]XP_052195847.1 calmodulin-lysine N-methyltransferase [Diospyros lotus]XP_052195848.1 calmodulin-lysine N-methyltransferase [Diospyros lotus]XP_052195849.1 cal